MLNKQYEEGGEKKRPTHRALYIAWTDQWLTLTCSMPARQGTRERKTAGLNLLQQAGVEIVFGNRWIPTDLCPFTLDTLTMEPLVLIRWGTQWWVRWYTDLERWKQRDRVSCTCLEWTRHRMAIWANEFCFVPWLWFPVLFMTVRPAMWTSSALFMPLLEFYINVLCVCSTIWQNQFTKLSNMRFYRLNSALNGKPQLYPKWGTAILYSHKWRQFLFINFCDSKDNLDDTVC